MVIFRIISRLDIKGEFVVKGIQLEGLRKINDAKVLAEQYYNQGADELALLDIVASLYKRDNLFSLITQIAAELRIPLTAIGGIRTLKDAQDVFEAGADKLGVNSSAIADPKFISQIARTYGSQSVVCSVEAQKANLNNSWFCFTENGRNNSGVQVKNWIPNLDLLGAGELFLTSVDRDGTNEGPDFELCKISRDLTQLPIIYSGGIRNSEDIYQLYKIGLDGCAVGSALHYDRLKISEIKSNLSLLGVPVRSVESSI